MVFGLLGTVINFVWFMISSVFGIFWFLISRIWLIRFVWIIFMILVNVVFIVVSYNICKQDRGVLIYRFVINFVGLVIITTIINRIFVH